MYRVILQGWLESWLPPWTAIVISSALFCAGHGYPDSLALGPLALTLGYVYHRRRSYLTVVVTHAAFNAVMLLLMALQDSSAGNAM